MHLAAVKTEQMQDKTRSRNKAFGRSVKSEGFCLSPDPNSAARNPDSIFKKQCARQKDVCATPAEHHLTRRTSSAVRRLRVLALVC